METILEILSKLPPSALIAVLNVSVIGGLGYIIYLLVSQNRGTVESISELKSNHLHELPDIAETLRRMEAKQDSMAAALLGHLSDIRVSQATIIAKLNGKSH